MQIIRLSRIKGRLFLLLSLPLCTRLRPCPFRLISPIPRYPRPPMIKIFGDGRRRLLPPQSYGYGRIFFWFSYFNRPSVDPRLFRRAQSSSVITVNQYRPVR